MKSEKFAVVFDTNSYRNLIRVTFNTRLIHHLERPLKSLPSFWIGPVIFESFCLGPRPHQLRHSQRALRTRKGFPEIPFNQIETPLLRRKNKWMNAKHRGSAFS